LHRRSPSLVNHLDSTRPASSLSLRCNPRHNPGFGLVIRLSRQRRSGRNVAKILLRGRQDSKNAA
jgi:hypothetical protein